MSIQTSESLSSLAAALADAERTGSPIAPLRDVPEVSDVEAAYSIQQINTQRRLDAGGRLVGRKIGLTSPAVQKQLGVDSPDFGALFSDMAVGPSEPVEIGNFVAPKIEGEVALLLGRDIDSAQATIADIILATEYAVAAIEIVDSRIRDWDIGLLDTVADNASAAKFTLGGTPFKLDGIDLSAAKFAMICGTETVSEGSGKDCLGHPLNAAVWLARTLAERGDPLCAGDVVMTGALGPMTLVEAGKTYTARIEGLGEVSTSFV